MGPGKCGVSSSFWEMRCRGKCGPGRSGGCPPELPQSRACGFPAPGSSRRGSAVPHTAKRFGGDTPSRLGVLGMVPTPRHDAAPPSLHGVREGSFPRFNATMRRCDSLPPISPHFVSFAWRYHRCDRCLSPIGPGRGAVDRPGVGMPVSPAGLLSGDGRVSQVPRGALVIIRPVLRPRRDQAG